MLEAAGASSNFAMAVDADKHRVLVVFRNPARIVAFATRTGKPRGVSRPAAMPTMYSSIRGGAVST